LRSSTNDVCDHPPTIRYRINITDVSDFQYGGVSDGGATVEEQRKNRWRLKRMATAAQFPVTSAQGYSP